MTMFQTYKEKKKYRHVIVTKYLDKMYADRFLVYVGEQRGSLERPQCRL